MLSPRPHLVIWLTPSLLLDVLWRVKDKVDLGGWNWQEQKVKWARASHHAKKSTRPISKVRMIPVLLRFAWIFLYFGQLRVRHLLDSSSCPPSTRVHFELWNVHVSCRATLKLIRNVQCGGVWNQLKWFKHGYSNSFSIFFKSLIFNFTNASRNNFQAIFSAIETWKSQVLMSQWLIFLVLQLKRYKF